MRKENKSVDSVIYIGPTIPGVVTKATVFNNGVPDALKAASRECPAIDELLVPIAQAAQKNNEIALKTGATFEFYKKVCSFIIAKNKEV